VFNGFDQFNIYTLETPLDSNRNCAADYAANYFRCAALKKSEKNRKIENLDAAIAESQAHVFREAAVNFLQHAGIECFDKSPYAVNFNLTSKVIVGEYRLAFSKFVAYNGLEWLRHTWDASRLNLEKIDENYPQIAKIWKNEADTCEKIMKEENALLAEKYEHENPPYLLETEESKNEIAAIETESLKPQGLTRFFYNPTQNFKKNQKNP